MTNRNRDDPQNSSNLYCASSVGASSGGAPSGGAPSKDTPTDNAPGTPRSNRRDDQPVAVALNYDRENRDSAPVVTASGRGLLAEQILELAAKEGVPIQEDSDLVELLAATEIGDEIPVDAFVAVAEILRYVYALNRSFPNPPPEREDLIATAGRRANSERENPQRTEAAGEGDANDGNPNDPYSAV